jgi:hypothetical protein
VARTAVALALLAGSFAAVRAAITSRQVFDAAWERRLKSYEELRADLFGRDYLDSVSAIRARVPASGSIFFVDTRAAATSRCYFALHDLAPRRLIRLGRLGTRSLARRIRRAPPEAAEILVIEEDRPLRLVPRVELEDDGRIDPR